MRYRRGRRGRSRFRSRGRRRGGLRRVIGHRL